LTTYSGLAAEGDTARGRAVVIEALEAAKPPLLRIPLRDEA
jgi:hypothetical protein